MTVEEKKKLRFKFLEHLYNTVDGDSRYSVNMWELGAELEIDRERIGSIVQYLTDEYLIEPRGLGGTIAISHAGTLEVEEAISNPDSSTEHFLPINIISIGSMSNSAIQQGNYQSNQEVNFKADSIKQIGDLIVILNDHIKDFEMSNDERNELVSEKETLESQVKSPKPKKIIIRESLKTIRSLMEGAASSIIASQVIGMIDTLA